MRLLYQYMVSKISKENCRIVVDNLESRVANDLINPKRSQGRGALPTEAIYKFITTSRPVENWLQASEQNVQKMTDKKIPTELWMIIGGYGAGKSHVKEYMIDVVKRLRKEEEKKLTEENETLLPESIALEIAELLQTDLSPTSRIDSIYALILLQTMKYLKFLRDKIYSHGQIDEWVRDFFSDNEFLNILCSYREEDWHSKEGLRPLRNLITERSGELFLPLMCLYKKYLKVGGFYIFIDEFEDLKYLTPSDRQNRFFESIRSLYDVLVNAYTNVDLPSFSMIVLCTLSYWEELKATTSSQGLGTRVKEFEIPQLVEDEIIAMAEKLYVLFKKSGYLKHELSLDLTKTPKYLARIAGIKEPLTPRFVIKELINIIEEPTEYIGYLSQSQ